MIRFGLIGYGGIARTVLDTLETVPDVMVSAVLVRPDREPDERPDTPFVDTLDRLLASGPDIVGECAGHKALAEFGPTVLRSGVDLVAVSIGALADEKLHDALIAAAEAGGSRLILPAGAIGAIDALAAARFGGLARVCYRSRKPPKAWAGSPAEDSHDLAALSEPTTLYEGTAREAARLYPKNANVAATVALAGLGFDDTQVCLVADPTVAENVHEIEAEGGFGSFSIRLAGKPSPDNPKTSLLTALSLSRAIAAEGSVVLI